MRGGTKKRKEEIGTTSDWGDRMMLLRTPRGSKSVMLRQSSRGAGEKRKRGMCDAWFAAFSSRPRRGSRAHRICVTGQVPRAGATSSRQASRRAARPCSATHVAAARAGGPAPLAGGRCRRRAAASPRPYAHRSVGRPRGDWVVAVKAQQQRAKAKSLSWCS